MMMVEMEGDGISTKNLTAAKNGKAQERWSDKYKVLYRWQHNLDSWRQFHNHVIYSITCQVPVSWNQVPILWEMNWRSVHRTAVGSCR
jgi:hypothetical protein